MSAELETVSNRKYRMKYKREHTFFDGRVLDVGENVSQNGDTRGNESHKTADQQRNQPLQGQLAMLTLHTNTYTSISNSSFVYCCPKGK